MQYLDNPYYEFYFSDISKIWLCRPITHAHKMLRKLKDKICLCLIIAA